MLAPLIAAPFPARWLAGPGSELIPAPNPCLPKAMALSGPTPAPSWEEDECLDYYGMLSLHRMFEVVGGQLTECELELLAFLLDEAPGAAGGLARARSGLELLLELERRGQCDESNLRLLGQLLRVLARHDLLPHLTRKRRRPGMCDGGVTSFPWWEELRAQLAPGSGHPDRVNATDSHSVMPVQLYRSIRNSRGRKPSDWEVLG